MPAFDTPARLRVLVVHGETEFCAGAQRMLAYYLRGTEAAGAEVAVARAPAPGLDPLLPAGTTLFDLPRNQRFSVPGLFRQVQAIRGLRRRFPFEILHGWTARDWELTAAASLATGRPGVGLLHDHPAARHISQSRRRMMRLCARWRLSRVICVSAAVAQACKDQGYPENRLRVVHNGIPMDSAPLPPRDEGGVRLGFLGVFSERKGMRTLFQVMDALATQVTPGWTLTLAGGTQDTASERLIQDLHAAYSGAPWWPRVEWIGWVANAAEFLRQIDILVVPSSEFDPFPTVLLEAGASSRPAFAARVGGVPEIIRHGETGWLFDPGDTQGAARELAEVLRRRDRLAQVGAEAARQARQHFALDRMARDYGGLYREVLGIR